jgi:Xaa-Pro aminopeptidase
VKHANRLKALRAQFEPERIDCLLVSLLPNIFYLTGFTGSAGILLVTERNVTLFTDGRYAEQAAEEVQGTKVAVPRGGAQRAALARAARCRRIGFEASAGYRFFRRLADTAGARRVRAVENAVERLRMVKDEQEIERIRRSVALNSLVFEETLPLLRPDMTEREVAAELEYRMRRRGADQPAFETVVASGPRSAMPHARASGRKLGKNGLLVLDHGAILAAYASDMTRTVCLGASSGRERALYQVVREAQQRAIEAVRAGVSCSSVDAAARKHIARRGYARQFPHSTGHGLGLEVHEAPRIAASEKSILPAGAVITIEPGVYVPGFGGVRIEDVVVVRERGAQVLTSTPKAFVKIG